MNDAGRIGFVIRGKYSDIDTYDFLDVVYYGGASYVAKKLTVGNEPQENDEYWQILVGKLPINSKTTDGYVPKSDGKANLVYGTDESGNPVWRKEHKGFYATFSDGTWAEIETMLKLHYAGEINIADYWSVGDEKIINVSSFKWEGDGENNPEQQATLVIIDTNQDNLVNPISGKTKAAVTIGFKNSLNGRSGMNGYNNNVNTGGWAQCLLRTNCNSIFLNALPEGLQHLIKEVIKKSLTGNASTDITSSNNRIWLPSIYEVNLEQSSSAYKLEATCVYEYYKTESNRLKSTSGGDNNWWSRSANTSGTTGYLYIKGTSYAIFTASSYAGIAPHFCI